MMKLLSLKLIFFVLIISFTLQSCAGVKNPGSSKHSAHAKANTRNSIQASSQSPSQVADLAQKNINAGEYQKAINIYNNEFHRQPQNLKLRQMYVKSLEGIRSTADSAFEKKDFAGAGRVYNVLQKNYGKFSHVVQMLSFNNAYLNTRISCCKKSLTVQGFREYRKGHLNSALLLWQGVLDIDPNNKVVKDAVRTAKLQQKNLPQK